MAIFDISWAPLRQFEGGYDNDPHDRGGETYAGIARNFFPKWEGWPIVDKYRSLVGSNPKKLTQTLAEIPSLQSLVKDWYRAEWWDRLGLAKLPQILADEIFEQAVNLGKAGCGRKLQEIINAWNWDGKETIFPDLVIDGAIGPKTLDALKILLAGRADARSLVHALNCMQGEHYIGLAARDATQRKYIRGWMKRTFDPESDL